ncbi:MAG: hypothetical protein ACLF0G_03920 [Candidatus Brocadiia bacterium]
MARVFLLAFCVVLMACGPGGAAERQNLALGRKVAFAPAPNYRLTAKGGTDATDLTDGKLSSREDQRLWFDPAAVGFSYAGLVQMAVDLGAQAPVGEVAVRFQGGSPQAGICFPGFVHLLASSDGVRYYRVASCSRWSPSGRARYGVPPNEGEPWVHTLRFGKADVRARYIGLAFYGAGLSASDELWVYEGEREACRPPSHGATTDFSLRAPRIYFHKPELYLPNNINAPTPIGLIVPPGFQKTEATLTIDMPKRHRIAGGHLGGTSAAGAATERVGSATRYTFQVELAESDKAWGRLYLRSDRSTGRRGWLRYQLRWPGGEGLPREIHVHSFRVPSPPTPRRLVTGLGWWSLRDTLEWPEALQAFRTLGFNTLPLFARYTDLDDPEVQATVQRFREAGFRILNIDSPFHHMLAKAGEQRAELTCQFPDGTHGEAFCPSYRGPLYEAELDRVARQTAAVRADLLCCDIELWSWRGPVDAPKCTRCQARFQASGAEDWQAWQLDQGEAIWRQLASRVRAACARAGAPEPQLGVYDWRPGHDYQRFWPFDRLYPQCLSSSQPSTYTPLDPYHLELIGDETRADRARLPRSDVLPWLTPGDAGTFPGEHFTYALLECFANGARGTLFWSGRVWDPETLAGYAEALRIVAPVEDVVVDGELASGVRCRPPMRVSGMRRGREMFLLVADYRSDQRRFVSLELPLGGPLVVRDLKTGREVVRLAEGQRRFRLAVGDDLARALHVEPQ